MSVFDQSVGGGRKSALGSVLSQSTITNVKTVVRVRPPTRKELETSAEFCLDRHGNSCSIRPPGGDVEKSKNFDFDRVLWVDSSQEETYLYVSACMMIGSAAVFHSACPGLRSHHFLLKFLMVSMSPS